MPCSLRLWTYLPPQAQIALLSLGFFLSFSFSNHNLGQLRLRINTFAAIV